MSAEPRTPEAAAHHPRAHLDPSVTWEAWRKGLGGTEMEEGVGGALRGDGGWYSRCLPGGLGTCALVISSSRLSPALWEAHAMLGAPRGLELGAAGREELGVGFAAPMPV